METLVFDAARGLSMEEIDALAVGIRNAGDLMLCKDGGAALGGSA